METKAKKKPGPPKTKGKDPPRSIRVPDSEWHAWQKKAAKRGVSLAALIREKMNG